MVNTGSWNVRITVLDFDNAGTNARSSKKSSHQSSGDVAVRSVPDPENTE